MILLNKSPIAKKLMIMIVAFSTIITIITTAVQLFFDYKKDLQGLNRQIEAIKTTQIETLSRSIWTFDSQGIQIIIDNALNIQDIEYLSVYASDKYSWSGGNQVSRKTIDTTIPIHFQDGGNRLTIGSLRIVASLDNVYERLLKKAVMIFISNGIKTFFVSLFILFLFQRLVTRHLVDLEKYAIKVAAGAARSPFKLSRVKKTEAKLDELDNVTFAINHMREHLQLEIQKIKKTEQALRANQEDLRDSQRIARLGSWRLDIATDEVTWSEELYKIYGFDPAYAPPPYPEHQKLFKPESWERLSTALAGTVETGIPYELELETVREDGSNGWMWVHGEAVDDEEGNRVALKGAAQDITLRKQVEEDYNRLTLQLFQAQKMEAIGTLAGGIAHDFNNILGAIIGYSEMIRNECPTESITVSYINQVLNASNRAKELVKQILAFSRHSETDLVPLQPAPIVKEALALLRSSLPTTIDIKRDIDSDAGVVLADPTQIHQIVINLCTNAFHAMETAGGTLTVSLHQRKFTSEDLLKTPQLQPGTYIQLSVKDTGSGISPEIKKKIFEPFFTTKEVGKGTGMGLAMIHGIVESYGGSITCESEMGKGSVFHILLPIVDGSALQQHDSSAKMPTGDEHILLIDDEQILLDVGRRMLEYLGYKVTEVADSVEAYTIFREQPDAFDLVITDQTMPKMTGVELSQRFLQIRPDIPIILCTGYSSIISEGQAEAQGIKGFAMKPLAMRDIGSLIRRVLD